MVTKSPSKSGSSPLANRAQTGRLPQAGFSQITTDLLLWFQEHGRTHLPWRQSGLTPYHIWLSEIMLQQTQVSRVIPYFERMVTKFPTVQDLAQSSWEEFLPYYQGLGYYSRGRNMLKTAQKIVTEFQGEFPQNRPDLLSLPGVGPYTAAAILSFGHNQPHLAFDTNHQRVWGRVLFGNKNIPVESQALENALSTQTSKISYRELNAAVMDLANAVCVNRAPKCEVCPLRTYCHYAQTAGTLEPTTFVRKSTFPAKEAQTIVILHQQHKTYFSAEPKKFTPFILPAPLNTRARIKEYFARQYGLNISVRPPHWRGGWQEKATQIVHAQILAGEQHFPEFSPAEQKNWWKEFEADATPEETK